MILWMGLPTVVSSGRAAAAPGAVEPSLNAAGTVKGSSPSAVSVFPPSHPSRELGESLFGTSGANRSTKLAQLRGCDSAVARRGRGRGSGSSTQRFTFPTFLKGGEGGKQQVRRKRVCTDTLACVALTCTRCSRTLFLQDICWRRTGAAQGAEHCSCA